MNIREWDTKNRFDGHKFLDLLSANRVTEIQENEENGCEYNRLKFNRLEGEEQKKYIKKLNVKKITYSFSIDNEKSFFNIPEEVFNLVKKNYPEIKISKHNYYIKF